MQTLTTVTALTGGDYNTALSNAIAAQGIAAREKELAARKARLVAGVEKLRAAGFVVYVIDSREAVDAAAWAANITAMPAR